MYTLGFIFDHTKTSVLLIHKNRPDWQKGKVNGIGGHIEKGEEPIDSFIREVREETGAELNPTHVHLVGYIQSPESLVYVYTTLYAGKKEAAASGTDEKIAWFATTELPPNIMSNLSWLIPLSLDKLHDETLQTTTITYI